MQRFCRRKMCNDIAVNTVGLFQISNGLCKVAHIARVSQPHLHIQVQGSNKNNVQIKWGVRCRDLFSKLDNKHENQLKPYRADIPVTLYMEGNSIG